MSIVTRTGDKGETGLFGPERTSKASARMHATGTVDELNAVLGVLRAQHPMPEPISSQITRIQHLLFTVGADLATPQSNTMNAKRVTENHVGTLERWIEELEEQLPMLQSFILPDGSAAGATLHLARTVCRRAERWVVSLKGTESINPQILIFLNRLGDYLFLAARAANGAQGKEETAVRYE